MKTPLPSPGGLSHVLENRCEPTGLTSALSSVDVQGFLNWWTRPLMSGAMYYSFLGLCWCKERRRPLPFVFHSVSGAHLRQLCFMCPTEFNQMAHSSADSAFTSFTLYLGPQHESMQLHYKASLRKSYDAGVGSNWPPTITVLICACSRRWLYRINFLPEPCCSHVIFPCNSSPRPPPSFTLILRVTEITGSTENPRTSFHSLGLSRGWPRLVRGSLPQTLISKPV